MTCVASARVFAVDLRFNESFKINCGPELLVLLFLFENLQQVWVIEMLGNTTQYTLKLVDLVNQLHVFAGLQ